MNISKSTIVRTIMIALVIVNMLLEKLGVDVIKTDENNLALVVEYLVEILAILAAWWYNNSFSQNALKAQKFLEQLRNGTANLSSISK